MSANRWWEEAIMLIHGEPYPVTIVAARYGGSYEGAKWLAFARDPDDLPDGWDGCDLTCAHFFDLADAVDAPIGKGATPNEALARLIGIAQERDAKTVKA